MEQEYFRELQKKQWLKHAIDPIIAFCLIIFLSPLYLAVVLLILIDGWMNPANKGRVFYLEPRVSCGKIFHIIKFRTIRESSLRWVEDQPDQRSITGGGEKTGAGKIILNWYLDELPQLFNILKGEMSFVGPRPHILKMHEGEIQQGMIYRNCLKAGLLGVPQATKRHPKYQELFRQMARANRAENDALNTLDGIYVKKCMELSPLGILFFDFSLILRGLIVVFRGGGV